MAKLVVIRLRNEIKINMTENKKIEIVLQKALPDLTLSPSDITFSKNNPIENETIFINATIHNVGSLKASRFKILISDIIYGDNINDTRILNHEDKFIDSLLPGESKTVSVQWKLEAGNHTIQVHIDPNIEVEEINNATNFASKNITVSPQKNLDNHKEDKDNYIIFFILIIATTGVIILFRYGYKK